MLFRLLFAVIIAIYANYLNASNLSLQIPDDEIDLSNVVEKSVQINIHNKINTSNSKLKHLQTDPNSKDSETSSSIQPQPLQSEVSQEKKLIEFSTSFSSTDDPSIKNAASDISHSKLKHLSTDNNSESGNTQSTQLQNYIEFFEALFCLAQKRLILGWENTRDS